MGRPKKLEKVIEKEIKKEVEETVSSTLPNVKVVFGKPKITSLQTDLGRADLNTIAAKINEVIERVNE